MAKNFAVLKLDGVEGESQLEGFDEHIDLDHYALSFTNASSAGSGSGQGVGAGMAHDIPCSGRMDTSSANLMQLVATGEKVIAEGSIKQYTGDAQNKVLMFELNMKHIKLTSFHASFGSGQELCPVQFQLSPIEMRWSYKKQNEDGTQGASYDGGFHRAKGIPL